MWKTVQASTLKGNQTGYEEELVRRLRDVMPEGVKVTVLADRGFASCRLMTLLKEELGFEYVIRLRGNYYLKFRDSFLQEAIDNLLNNI